MEGGRLAEILTQIRLRRHCCLMKRRDSTFMGSERTLMTADLRAPFLELDPERQQLTGLEALRGLSVPQLPEALRTDQYVPRQGAPDSAPRLARRARDHRSRQVRYLDNTKFS